MFYYLETSALVKLYVQEPGTERLLKIASSKANQFALLALSQVEFSSALHRRQRSGDIGKQDVIQLLKSFDLHLRTRFLRQSVNDSVLDAALELTGRYPLRAYDAIQLAGCFVFQKTVSETPIFICSDKELLNAADDEGLACLDPTS